MKKLFKVPVVWSMYGYIRVEAENIDEAIELAEQEKLPIDGEYVEGSFEVDRDVIEEGQKI